MVQIDMKIAIASGKGGTGKTTLAVNLASFLSHKDHLVSLVDLDVEEPNSGLFIKGEKVDQVHTYKAIPKWDENKCTLCGVCKEVCHFNAIAELQDTIILFPELCHSCYACSELCKEEALPMQNCKTGTIKSYKISDALFFTEGIMDIGQESAVPTIKQTKEYVNKKFPGENRIIIYDAPPGASCPVIETVKDTDLVILVTEPTSFGLHDLKIAVDAIKQLQRNFGVVINRYGIGDNRVDNYCEKNNISIMGKIPYSKEAANLYSKGDLLYKQLPEVENAIHHIYRNMMRLILDNETVNYHIR